MFKYTNLCLSDTSNRDTNILFELLMSYRYNVARPAAQTDFMMQIQKEEKGTANKCMIRRRIWFYDFAIAHGISSDELNKERAQFNEGKVKYVMKKFPAFTSLMCSIIDEYVNLERIVIIENAHEIKQTVKAPTTADFITRMRENYFKRRCLTYVISCIPEFRAFFIHNYKAQFDYAYKVHIGDVTLGSYGLWMAVQTGEKPLMSEIQHDLALDSKQYCAVEK